MVSFQKILMTNSGFISLVASSIVNTLSKLSCYSHNTIGVLLLLLPLAAIAQTPRDTTRQLSPIILSLANDSDTLMTDNPAVTRISDEAIARGRQTTVADALNRQAGIIMQQGALNTARITLRGIGARSQFSTNRLRAFIEGIPITNGEGATSMEDIDPAIINSINVIKGPAGAIYGAGLGGAIALDVKDPDTTGFSGGIAGYAGSYDQLRTNVNANAAVGKVGIRASYNRLTSDGYRENSNYRRDNVFAFAKAYLPSNSRLKTNTLSFLASYTDLKAFIPSSLSVDDFNDDPSSAADNWAAARGFESYKSLLSGITYKSQNIENGSFAAASGYFNIRNGFEPRPFDILDDQQRLMGVRLHLGVAPFKIAKREVQLSLLLEGNRGNLRSATFENIAPQNGSSQGGVETRSEGETTFLFGGAQWSQKLTDKLSMDIGVSISDDRYQLQNLLSEEGVRERNFGIKTMSTYTLSYDIDESATLTAYASRGYSLPALEEIRTEAGDLNEDINAEKGWNFELSFDKSWLRGRLRSQLNLYTIQVSDLLVSERITEGVDVARNAGSADHHGVEASLDWLAVRSGDWKLRPQINFSLNQYYFDKFVEEGEDFSGNQLTGIPRHVLNASLLTTYRDFELFINGRHTGEIPLNDANALYTDEYFVLNAQLRYQKTIDKLSMELYGGANNVLNQLYPSQVLPNAPSFGGRPARYYYPGDPFNVYFGLRLNYN